MGENEKRKNKAQKYTEQTETRDTIESSLKKFTFY